MLQISYPQRPGPSTAVESLVICTKTPTEFDKFSISNLDSNLGINMQPRLPRELWSSSHRSDLHSWMLWSMQCVWICSIFSYFWQFLILLSSYLSCLNIGESTILKPSDLLRLLCRNISQIFPGPRKVYTVYACCADKRILPSCSTHAKPESTPGVHTESGAIAPVRHRMT